MTAILITVQDGGVDFITDDPDAQIVFVDFDALNPDTAFPDDVEVVAAQVLGLPQGFPWKRGVITRLAAVKKACKRSLWAGPEEEL